jgi:F0F1-type ATP synthase membrane subunit b/b'
MAQQNVERNIPVLTDIIANASSLLPSARDQLVAELQTKLASRTFALAEELLRSAVAEMEANLIEQISTQLRRELPEIIDATLREHLGAPGSDRDQE